MVETPDHLISCPHCGLRCAAYVTACPGCGTPFDGRLGDEELDTGGILEATGIGAMFALLSSAGTFVLFGGWVGLDEADWPAAVFVLSLGVVAPLAVLAATWVRLGFPSDVSRFRASDLVAEPRLVGIATPPVLLILSKLVL